MLLTAGYLSWSTRKGEARKGQATDSRSMSHKRVRCYRHSIAVMQIIGPRDSARLRTAPSGPKPRVSRLTARTCAIARSWTERLRWRGCCAILRLASCLTNTLSKMAPPSLRTLAGLGPRASLSKKVDSVRRSACGSDCVGWWCIRVRNATPARCTISSRPLKTPSL
jgi:hypothetical protein